MQGMNRQITLVSRPQGAAKPSDFRLVESPIPAPGDGEVLVRTLYLSVDPYQRSLLDDFEGTDDFYARPVEIGGVIGGGVCGEVVESKHPNLKAGDLVEAYIGWQEYGCIEGGSLRKVNPDLGPISTSLGVLGMPGLTAYFGLLDLGLPKAGETVLVSTAAGAVGSIVGQIAKIQGCRVIGTAGSEDKVRHVVDDLGFDTAFNYKTVDDYLAKLQEVCPEGIDVYFDNVGGDLTDAVFMHINEYARLVICGQITQYDMAEPDTGPRLLGQLIGKRARVEGFLVDQFVDKYEQGISQMAEWIRDGRLKYREHIIDGIENTPEAFLRMMRGDNTGKQLVKVV